MQKPDKYALMFAEIGECLKKDCVSLSFSHPFDIDARYESWVLWLQPMPFEDPDKWAKDALLLGH